MDRSGYQARRANVDDLPELRHLWATASYAPVELEKHVTEFQIIEDPEGAIVACMGLEIESGQGNIHSESYTEPGLAEDLRVIFWERLQSLARNFNLARFWIQQPSSGFWQKHGFNEPNADVLSKLPARLAAHGGPWLTLKLRDESLTAISIEHEFDLFKQHQRELSERAMRQARVLKVVAWILLAIGFAALGALAWKIFKKIPPVK